MSNYLETAYNAFKIESESILKTAEVLDKNELQKAIEVLAKAERIASSGCGHSGIACRHFAHLMCCIERPARFLSPAEAVHGGLGYLQKGDVILLVSRGGKTDELIPIGKICKDKGVTVITVTENSASPLAELADIVLLMHITRECDKYNCQGTTSSTALAVIFHVLQTALIEETDFQNEQFALVHPGGAVGERLNK